MLQYFRVPEMFEKEGGVENQDFPSKFFCVTVPKKFAGEPFFALFQKNSGSEKDSG